jgi:hypothetical protein
MIGTGVVPMMFVGLGVGLVVGFLLGYWWKR